MTEKKRRKAPFTAHQVTTLVKKVNFDIPSTRDIELIDMMLKDYALCLRREEEAALQEL